LEKNRNSKYNNENNSKNSAQQGNQQIKEVDKNEESSKYSKMASMNFNNFTEQNNILDNKDNNIVNINNRENYSNLQSNRSVNNNNLGKLVLLQNNNPNSDVNNSVNENYVIDNLNNSYNLQNPRNLAPLRKRNDHRSAIKKIQRRDRKFLGQDKNRYMNSFLPHRNLIEALSKRERITIGLSSGSKFCFSLCYCFYRSRKNKQEASSYIDGGETLSQSSKSNSQSFWTHCWSRNWGKLTQRVKSWIFDIETMIVYKLGTELAEEVNWQNLVMFKNSFVNMKNVLFNQDQNLLLSLLEALYSRDRDIKSVISSNYLLNADNEFLIKCNKAYNTVISEISNSEKNKNLIEFIDFKLEKTGI